MADSRYGRDEDRRYSGAHDRDWRQDDRDQGMAGSRGRDRDERGVYQDQVFNQGYGTGYGGRYGEGGYGASGGRSEGRDFGRHGDYDRAREGMPDQSGYGTAIGYGQHDNYGAGRGSLHDRADRGQWGQGGPTSMGGGRNEFGQDQGRAGYDWSDRGGSEAMGGQSTGSYPGHDQSGQGGLGQSRQAYGLGQGDHDDDHLYRSWRDRQMQAFDRDYDDFRRHRQERFNADFEEWRKSRGGPGSEEGFHREQQQAGSQTSQAATGSSGGSTGQSSSQKATGGSMTAGGSETGAQSGSGTGSSGRRSGTSGKSSGTK